MKTRHAGLDQYDSSRPLAVPPRLACQLLSVGLTRLYELLNAGELESFHIGRARRITLASIHAYIELNRSAACRGQIPIEGEDHIRSRALEPTCMESNFANAAVSISKVIETMTDSVMQAIVREMANLGIEGGLGDRRALRESLYRVVTVNVIDATVRKVNESTFARLTHIRL
jgi:excisionase family DNA binding protein